MNPLILKWYMQSKLCKLSYSEYSFNNFKKISAKNVHCHIVSFRKTKNCLVVRGSKDLNDYKMDISLNKEYDKDLNIYIHSGFRRYARNLVDVLLTNDHLDKSLTYDLTGHSAGASTSIIAGLLLQKEGFNISSATTFGQPPFTDKDGVLYVNEKLNNYARFVIDEDIVCLFHEYYPFNALKYEHCGKLIKFDKLSNNLITNHKIDAYITRLKELIREPEQCDCFYK